MAKLLASEHCKQAVASALQVGLLVLVVGAIAVGITLYTAHLCIASITSTDFWVMRTKSRNCHGKALPRCAYSDDVRGYLPNPEADRLT